MSYDPIEDRLQDILQLLTSRYSNDQTVTRGDWSVLDRGYTHSAILYPGPFNDADMEMGPGGRTFLWTVNVEIFLRFENNRAAIATFGAYRDDVIQHLMKYPSLSPATLTPLTNATLLPNMSGGDIQERFDKANGGPFFLSQVIQVKVSNIIFVTLAE
jgi:hypothetical protein